MWFYGIWIWAGQVQGNWTQLPKVIYIFKCSFKIFEIAIVSSHNLYLNIHNGEERRLRVGYIHQPILLCTLTKYEASVQRCKKEVIKWKANTSRYDQTEGCVLGIMNVKNPNYLQNLSTVRGPSEYKNFNFFPLTCIYKHYSIIWPLQVTWASDLFHVNPWFFSPQKTPVQHQFPNLVSFPFGHTHNSGSLTFTNPRLSLW